MSSSADWVATALTRLVMPAVARRPRPALLDPTIRAAVLIDLALAGALVDTGGRLEVDTTPTGFAPADRLLTAVVAQPDHQLEWWLYHAPITVADVADVLVTNGEWERHGPLRRYRDLQPDQTSTAARYLRAAVERDCTPVEATVAILATLLPVPELRFGVETEELLDQCRSAAWLVRDLVANLQLRQRILQASAQDASNAQGANFIF